MPVKVIGFRDRASAGLLIARRIACTRSDDTVVVAIPHGGVPVLRPIADRLGIPAKVCLTARITLPGDPELSVGTMSCAGDLHLDAHMLEFLAASDDAIAAALRACREKITSLSTHLSPWGVDASLEGKHIVLVDDVIATGNHVLGSVQYLQQFKPRSVAVAAPVMSHYAVTMLAARHIQHTALIVSRQAQFDPREYYAEFEDVDGRTCADLLAAL